MDWVNSDFSSWPTVHGYRLEIQKVISDFTCHNFLGKNVMQLWLLHLNVCFRHTCWIFILLYVFYYIICQCFRVYSSWDIELIINSNSVLGTETPLICRWIMTTTNISWYIICHWATNSFFLVLPMISLALSFVTYWWFVLGSCQLQFHWTFLLNK